jgi:hypothetical protein
LDGLAGHDVLNSCSGQRHGRKKAPAWRRVLSKAGACSTVYIQYTIHPPSFNQIIKELQLSAVIAYECNGFSVCNEYFDCSDYLQVQLVSGQPIRVLPSLLLLLPGRFLV